MNITIEQLGIIVGILSAVAAGIYFCIKEYNSVKLRNRPRFQQSWTNEGDTTMGKKYTHFLYLEITEVEHGELVGIMRSRNLKEKYELENISVNGTIGLKSATVRLLCGRYPYGKVKLTLDKSRLKWKLIKGDTEALPNSTVMWKWEGSILDDLLQ